MHSIGLADLNDTCFLNFADGDGVVLVHFPLWAPTRTTRALSDLDRCPQARDDRAQCRGDC